MLHYTLGGWLLFLVTLATLVAFPLAFATDPILALSTTQGLLSYGLVVYGAIRIAHLVGRGVAAPSDIVLWSFVYTMFGAATFLQVDVDYFPTLTSLVGFTPGVEVLALLVVWAGVLAYQVGRVFGYRNGASSPRHPWIVSTLRVEILSVVAIGIAFLSIALAGGPAQLFTSRTEFDVGLSLFVVRAPIISAAILAVLCVRQGGTRWRDMARRTRWIFVTVVALSLLVNSPFVTARQWFGALWIGLAFSFLRPYQVRLSRAITLAVVASLLVLYPFLNEFRRGEDVAEHLRYKYSGVQASLTGTQDFAMFSQVQMSVVYARKNGHTLGRQLSTVALFYVPRSIWDGKAPDTGRMVSQDLGVDERFNFSMPLWGELFVEGGFVLLVAGFGLLGFVCGRGDRRYLGAFGSSVTLGRAAFVLFVGYESMILRGALLPIASRFGIPLLLVALCCRRARAEDATTFHETQGGSQSASAGDSERSAIAVPHA
jgi:hypothetical protein